MNLAENHILIGLGGTGGKILKAFRKRIFQEYTEEQRAKLPIGYVYVDSSMEMMEPGDVTWRVLGQDACFTQSEFVFIKGVDPIAVLKNPSGYPGLKGFIGDPEIMGKALGQIGAAAAQKRRAGRILFGSSVDLYKKTLIQQFNKANQISGAVRTNIHIFTGLAGGTGSGSIIDVIAQTRMMDQFRKELDPQGKTGTNIVVYCMVPEITPPGTSDAGRYHANGFAALTEINGLLTGKYIPHDVSGVSDRLNLDLVKKVADGCILYSNINEHGKIVDSFKQLPYIVSDFAYSRIFLEKNDNTEEFIRSYSFENINDWRFESYEKKENDLYRAKTFSSFGIKRIIIPEEEIKDYFTYSFGQQALLQMRFNNWNDDLGFRDKPASIDFHSFVKEPEQLEKWHMTDKHLILDRPILKDDQKKWPGFVDYWSSVIPAWTEMARQTKMPLNELEKYCSEGYEKLFRKAGVIGFFEGKTQSKEMHAIEISGLIEDYLFDKWSHGDLSLFNLLELTDRIIEYTDSKRRELEGKISTWIQTIDGLEKAKALNQIEWSNKGLIGGLLFKNKLIQSHSTIMQQLCIKKTEVEGLKFSVNMLGVLLTKLNNLRGRIEKFVSIINTSLEETENQLATRCNDEGDVTNLKEAVIRFYDKNAVVKFTQEVIKNKNRQKAISDEFRQQIVGLIGNDHTFARANATVTSDDISKLFDTIIREKAINIHDEILIEDNEKLINRNILEQLNDLYGSEDALRAFAKNIIEQSGVFLTFNNNETKRAVKYNPGPIQGMNIMRKIVLVYLPKPEGNEQVLKFAERLKTALTSAVQGGIEVFVDMNGERKNEITVSTISYCFPLRVMESLEFLKEKYNYLTNNPNEARQNRIVLHTEGTGELFPNLFVAEDVPAKEDTQYLILAYAMGLVKYGDRADGTGKSTYGVIKKGDWGIEILDPLADRFTEIIHCDTFLDEDFRESLRAKFEVAIKDDYLHVNKRDELKSKIQDLVIKVILPECNGNQGSEAFRFFSGKAKEALNLIDNA